MQEQRVLVINCGSSSLKFAVFNATSLSLECEGLAEALFNSDARIKINHLSMSAGEPETISVSMADHASALKIILDALHAYKLDSTLAAIGHRVVHGGEYFKTATAIDPDVYAKIEHCIPLAPLHNPANLTGIKLVQATFPKVPQVAVFDTAFHQSMPQQAYRYALPASLYEDHAVRRYGFHGTSHHYVSLAASAHINRSFSNASFISAHLGNGASVCAIKDGKSVDTSMGFTPLEGLVMGTRSGDIDPGIYTFLLRQGYNGDEVDTLLNKKSGLLGLSGLSNDCRTLEENASNGHAESIMALDVFCLRLAKYISAMTASLETCHGLLFTGGIGENSSFIRAKTIAHLKLLGFTLDEDRNEIRTSEVRSIHADTSRWPIYVVPTNEEAMIARQSLEVL